MARSIRQRLDQLDDNAYSEFMVGLSDSYCWWWNLGVGLALLLASPAAFAFGSTSDGVACAAFGSVGTLTGLALRAGRNRRRR